MGEKRCSRAMQRYEHKATSIARPVTLGGSGKILDYNLHCPVTSLGQFNIDVNEEMGKIVRDIEQVVAD